MAQKLAIAAFIAAGASLVVVLFSPAPKARPKPKGESAETVWLRVQAEMNMMDNDRAELERIAEQARGLDETLAAGPAGGPEARQEGALSLVREIAGGEMARLWPEYRSRLKTIKLYEKKK